jgi:hypothetical protein
LWHSHLVCPKCVGCWFRTIHRIARTVKIKAKKNPRNVDNHEFRHIVWERQDCDKVGFFEYSVVRVDLVRLYSLAVILTS